MNRILSVPMATRVALRRVSYRQDMPPPGGYPQMPWRRNIPQRGFGYIACLVLGLSKSRLNICLKTIVGNDTRRDRH